MAKSQKAIDDKWSELRRKIREELISRRDPLLWSLLILDIVANKSRLPNNLKLPMIHLVIQAFKDTPVTYFSWGYLETVNHDAMIRQHKGGYWKEAMYFRTAFTGLAEETELRFRIPNSVKSSSVPVTTSAPSHA